MSFSLTASLILLKRKIKKRFYKYILFAFALFFIDPLTNFIFTDFTDLLYLIGLFHVPFYIISALVALNSIFVIYYSLKENNKKHPNLMRNIKILYFAILAYLVYFALVIYSLYY